MIFLVDADIITYRAGFAAEKKRKVSHDDTGEIEHIRDVAPLSHALQNVDTVMESLYNKCGSLEVYLSGKGNFRDAIATIQPYKANRSKFARPVHYKAIREHLVNKWHAVVVDGMEADDALGLRQTEYKGRLCEDDPCIVSIDKDLLQIPGQHYNWVKNEYRTVTETDGLRNFYRQLLTGDSVDHIPGIEGVGPVKAGKVIGSLSSERAMYQAARNEWHKHYPEGYRGRSVDSAIFEIGSLLWIARQGRERYSIPERPSTTGE